jgi:hypothetical protein
MSQVIKKKYRRAGYDVPHIIYWNVRATTPKGGFPTKQDEEGVGMVSGFSPALLKEIMNGEIVSPIELLRRILSSERYSVLEL